MGEDKALICRDCKTVTEIGKIPLHGWETEDDWFDNEYRRTVACKLMGFLSDHKGHHVSLVGEYGIHQDEFFTACLEWDAEYELF